MSSPAEPATPAPPLTSASGVLSASVKFEPSCEKSMPTRTDIDSLSCTEPVLGMLIPLSGPNDEGKSSFSGPLLWAVAACKSKVSVQVAGSAATFVAQGRRGSP